MAAPMEATCCHCCCVVIETQYMALVPRSALEPVNMSIEDASRLVFTAGMSIQKRGPLEAPIGGAFREPRLQEATHVHP